MKPPSDNFECILSYQDTTHSRIGKCMTEATLGVCQCHLHEFDILVANNIGIGG
jgi:hypothetical protein